MNAASPGPERSAPSVRFLSWLRPRKAAGQIALLVIAAILVADLAATFMLFALREPWRADGRPGVAANRLATIARLLDETEPQDRPALLAAAARSLPSLHVEPWEAPARIAEDPNLAEHLLIERLRSGFGRTLEIAALTPPGQSGDQGEVLHLGLRTPNGATLRAVLPDDVPRPPNHGVVVFAFLVLAVSLTLLSVWVTRALTAPLAQLAAAAEAFGTRREAAPLPRKGPEEVLAVAQALDRMRARVNRLLDDRTQMLAAISHDLRTPITRLRLRAEFIDDPQARERTLRDLDQMNALVESALTYARDERAGEGAAEGAGPEQRPLLDLVSLVRTVCDGFSDLGADVAMAEARPILVRGQPEALERAVTNLVDNAVKYAGSARIGLEHDDGAVAITVADDGPGIPVAERNAMLEPFRRGDRARDPNMAGGFGLGLSIVRAIVQAHHGRLSLEDRHAGGLVVRITLPCAAPAQARPGSPATRHAAE